MSAAAKGPLSSWETQLALLELYETMYGIADHEDPQIQKRPLAIMALHTKENTRAYSPLYKRIDQFARLKIFETYGIPLDRFFALPTEYVQYIMALADAQTREETKAAEAMLAEAKGDGKGKGGGR